MLKGESETLKECLIEHIGANEATIIRTLAFGVSSGDDIESCCWFHIATSLLEEHTFALKNRLQAHNFVAGKINLIQQQNCTTLQCFNHRTIVPDSVTINQTETTDQIILVSLNSEVDADKFATKISTCLLNTEGLTVTRQTSDEHRIEDLRVDDLLYISEVAKWYESIVLNRNEILHHRLNNSRSSSRSSISLLKLLLNREVPLAITNLVLFNTLHDGRIGHTELSGSSTDCITTELITIISGDERSQSVHVNVDLAGHVLWLRTM